MKILQVGKTKKKLLKIKITKNLLKEGPNRYEIVLRYNKNQGQQAWRLPIAGTVRRQHGVAVQWAGPWRIPKV